MKALRILINVVFCFVLIIAISLTQIVMFDLTAAQSADVQGIHIFAGDDEKIGYFDTYGFWGTDIETNLQQNAKYRVRTWINAKWWKGATGWIDKSIDFVAGVVKPIFVPVAQINAVKEHYGYNINHFEQYLVKDWYTNEKEANEALYELFVIFQEGNGDAYIIGTDTPISQYDYNGSYKDKEFEDLHFEYEKWINSNKKLYNTNWKLGKYNSEQYEKYFTKFIQEDESGTRHIKVAAVTMYYQQFLSIILAILFVIKYPINLFQYNYAGKKKKGKVESTN